MSFFEYLPHEYSYACYLAYIYDLHPYDSTIHYMVSERYPREEDDDDASASASDSTYDEDEESGVDEVVTTSAQLLESSASHNQITFGSFDSPITPVSTSVIEPKFDGFSIKIGEISCVLVTPCSNIVNEDDSVFVDCALVDSRCNIVDDNDSAFAASEDDKAKNLETELVISEAIKKVKNQFVVPEAFVKSEDFVIDTLPVRSCSSVYGVASVKPLSSWFFIGQQTEPIASDVDNEVRFFQLHDEFIVDFDPGGISSCSLFYVYKVLRHTSFRLRWMPWDRGRKHLSFLTSPASTKPSHNSLSMNTCRFEAFLFLTKITNFTSIEIIVRLAMCFVFGEECFSGICLQKHYSIKSVGIITFSKLFFISIPDQRLFIVFPEASLNPIALQGITFKGRFGKSYFGSVTFSDASLERK
jgi:hypothetical protein